jgi:type IV fimbrial biogenesis protein FimT
MNTKPIKGFTLHELLISTTIVSVLVWSIGPLGQVVAKQRLQTTHSELATLITVARWQAMSNTSRVTLCPLQDHGRCQLPWSGTLTNFIDNNGNRTLDPGEEIIANITLPSHTTLTWRGMNPTHSLHFSGNGMTFVSNGTFTLCHRNIDETRRITLNKQGRLKSERLNSTCPH